MNDKAVPSSENDPQQNPIAIPSQDSIPRERKTHSIGRVLTSYIGAIEDYRDAVLIALPLVAKQRREEIDKTIEKLDHYKHTDVEDGVKRLRAEGPHAVRELLQTIRDMERLKDSRLIQATSRSFFIGAFSEYDRFIGLLLKALYLSQPALFKAIKREITLSELLDFHDLDGVRLDMLEKEIDAFRRQSYVEQFAELERKFEIKTLKAFPEWPEFIEMGQRRNLMTHNGGRVSQQYLIVCDKEGYAFEKRPTLNEELPLPPEYLIRTLLLITKVGLMLGHTLWRKLDPDTIEKAHESLNNDIYELLHRKRWRTAAELGRFGLSDPMMKNLPDILRKIRIVNTAIALKRSKQGEDALRLLQKEDWSACLREFKLANAVLKEEFSLATEIMREIGKKGELIQELAYHDWPLFEEFREHTEFHEAYESIYGTPFIRKATESAVRDTKALLEQGEPNEIVTASAIQPDIGEAKPN